MIGIYHSALPPADIGDWRQQAACKDTDSDVFFYSDGEEGPAASAARVAQARAVCRDCPVLLRCRAYAFAVAEPHGVWGGLTETERREQTYGDAQNVVISVDFTHGRRQGPHVPMPGSWPVVRP